MNWPWHGVKAFTVSNKGEKSMDTQAIDMMGKVVWFGVATFFSIMVIGGAFMVWMKRG